MKSLLLNYKPEKTKQLEKGNHGEKFAPNLSSSFTIIFFSSIFNLLCHHQH